MRRFTLLRYLSLVAIFAASAVSGLAGDYSRQATPLWDHLFVGAGLPPGVKRPSQVVVVHSPDRLSKVIVRHVESKADEHVSLIVSGRIGNLSINIGPGVGSELLWAPDSQSFFVTTSDGGRNGPYRLILVGRSGSGLRNRDISELIYSVFGHPVRCGWPEPPNVAGITWLPSLHILVAAEIVNHSNCDSFGTFKAYEVDPDNLAITRRLGQLDVKRGFGGLLGRELLHAPDGCIVHPKSCYVPANHESN